MYYGFYQSIKNVIRWTPVIWHDEDYDSAFLGYVMEFKLRKMSEYFKKYGCHASSDKQSREMLVCAEYLKRILDDEFRSPDPFHEERIHGYEKELGRQIGKHFRCWWD